MNRTSTYLVETNWLGGTHRVDTSPAGTRTDLLIDGDLTRTTTTPDGTVTRTVQYPDPRFYMLAPVQSSQTVTTPSGLTLTRTKTRTATLSDPANPLNLIGQTDTVQVNGRTYTINYSFDGTIRQATATTPAGRQTVALLDAQGRILRKQVPGLEPMSYVYDSRGHLTSVTQGMGESARTTNFTYNAQGFLDAVTDPVAHVALASRSTLPVA